MRTLMWPVATLLGLAGGALAVAASGLFDVSATVVPGKVEETVARFLVDRSVARRAPRTRNPLGASPEVLHRGLAAFRSSCVSCHGAPGVDPSDAGAGLNPPAPGLTLPRVQARSDGEIFWIVSHGVRMTGMPGFAPARSEREIWEIVAFVRRLPALDAAERKALAASPERSRPE